MCDPHMGGSQCPHWRPVAHSTRAFRKVKDHVHSPTYFPPFMGSCNCASFPAYLVSMTSGLVNTK